MIDTVALILNANEFIVTKPDLFEPSARLLLSQNSGTQSGFMRCVQNPKKQDLLKGIIKPKLTLTKRILKSGHKLNLKIEFSLPKVLFGNNFEEISYQNASTADDLIVSALHEMGVSIFTRSLKNKKLCGVHFSKNFILKDYTTCSMFLRELSKINFNSRLDLNQTDYRNGGHVVKYHANSYEVVFYDKLKDLEQSIISDKRAIESENCVQQKLLSVLKTKKPFEVLRMEVRLNSVRKIKSLFKKIYLSPPLCFGDLFQPHISQAVLLHFWNIIEAELKVLSFSDEKPEEVFDHLVRVKGLRPTKALQVIGLNQVLSRIGTRGIKKYLSTKTLNSLLDQNSSSRINSCYRIQSHIKQSLIDFLPVKLHN